MRSRWLSSMTAPKNCTTCTSIAPNRCHVQDQGHPVDCASEGRVLELDVMDAIPRGYGSF